MAYALLFLIEFLAAVLVWQLWSIRRLKSSLHLLQLDSYSNIRLFKWMAHLPGERLFALPVSAILGPLVLTSLILHGSLTILLLGLWIATGGYYFKVTPEPAQKKPLVFTSRANRILAVSVLLDVILAAQIFYTLRNQAGWEVDRSLFISFLVSVFASPVLVVLANILLIPLQKSVNYYYLSSAKKKLAQVSPVIVGITGSYGKTSTKYF